MRKSYEVNCQWSESLYSIVTKVFVIERNIQEYDGQEVDSYGNGTNKRTIAHVGL